MAHEGDRLELLNYAIGKALKLLKGSQSSQTLDDRFIVAVTVLEAALRREACLSMSPGRKLVLTNTRNVSTPLTGGRVIPGDTILRFTGHYDEQKIKCCVITVPEYKNELTDPVVLVGEQVWVFPEWCKAA